MDDVEFLHPANAEELANIAQETGAEVLRGALRYPSDSGGWQLGSVDLSEYLAKYRDQELVIIITSTGKADDEKKEDVVCGICGLALDEVRECPRCKFQNAIIAEELRDKAETDTFLQEIEEIARRAWDKFDREQGQTPAY